MSAELELALLVLNTVATEDVDPTHVGFDSLEDLLERMSPNQALNTAAAAADSDAPNDRFAAAQVFVLGVHYREARQGDVEEELRRLSAAVLGSAGVESPEDTADQLINAVANLSAGRLEMVFGEFRTAFGAALEVIAVTATEVNFTGVAAPTAAMVYEMATTKLPCRSRVAKVPVDGVLKSVTLVEIDVCTNLPFEQCRKGIDPLEWPRCNPYFVSVEVVGTKTPSPSGDGWAGVVREKVGPAMNGTYYTTDLAIRYLKQPGLAVSAFDLATVRDDDDRVEVDRGFLSVTDEGRQRRLRVLKVYRIKDLPMPQLFVCRLWVWQLALSRWWCP